MHVQTPAAYRRSFSILLAIALALVLGASGCAKQRANMAQKKAQTRLQDAKKYDAEIYKKADLQATEQQLQKAQGEMSGSQFDQALADAKSAQEMATKLLADTLQACATQLTKDNVTHLSVLRSNKLESNDKYPEVKALAEQADAAFAKQKYEKAIVASRQLKDKVDFMLQTLKDAAEAHQREVKAKRKALVEDEIGLEEVPARVEEVDKMLADFDALVAPDKRSYVEGEQLYLDICKRIDTAVTEARKSRSDKKIKVLEDKITTAVIEEAEAYCLAQLRECQDKLQEILKNYENKDFQQVLTQANFLDPSLDRLILESRLQAAKANVEQTRAGIRQLENGKVDDHLPGRLDKVKGILAQAEKEYSQDLYNDCKKTCKIALDEQEAIRKDFDLKAGDVISDARAKLDQADNILDQMRSIFESQSSASADPLEQAFENSKKGLQTQLETISKGADLLVAKAKVEREEKLFDSAIQSSRKVVSMSNRVIHDVYQVVAHNNVMELAKAITDREADGASELAADELQRAKTDLGKSRQMMLDVAAGEKAQAQEKNVQVTDLDVPPEAYRASVASTSEVRADIESILQRMKDSVQARIGTARESLAVADANKSDVYAPGPLATAHNLVGQAQDLLDSGKHSDAVQKAAQARELAFTSSVAAAKQWTSEQLTSAHTEIDKAEEAITAVQTGAKPEQKLKPEQAKADQEALKRLREAKAKRAEADELFAKAAQITDPEKAIASLTQSRDLATAAAEDAQGSRMDKIATANRNINAAKRFNAWKYDYPLLVDSVVLAKEAMEAMQRGEYEVSNQMALQATELAKKAMDHTKEVTFYSRSQGLSLQAGKVGEDGAAYFEQDKYLPLLLRLQEVRAGYTLEQFETVNAELDRFENDLLAIASKTPEAFDGMIQSERDRIERASKLGARDFALEKIQKAEQYLRFAEIDFKKNDPSSAYHNATAASGLITGIEGRLAEVQFANDVVALLSQIDEELKWLRGFRSLSKVEFQRVFAVSRPTQTGNVVIEGTDPAKFREAMDTLVLKSEALKYPISLSHQYAAQKRVFVLARQAGEAFEKFSVLSLYDEKAIGRITAEAFDSLDRALKERSELLRDLETKKLPGQLAPGKQHIAGE